MNPYDHIPPRARQVARESIHHGDVLVDEYSWMDSGGPDTIAHLREENDYAEAMTAQSRQLEAIIVAEFGARTKQSDLTVPTLDGRYWYYTRSVRGLQHPLYCRCPYREGEDLPPGASSGGDVPGEEVILDGNSMARSGENFAVGVFKISPDDQLLAYSVDMVGDERHTMRIRDLETGQDTGEEITGVHLTSAWYSDSRALIYVTIDSKNRPHQVWRHVLGTTPADDRLLFEERDERYWVTVSATRSQAFLNIHTSSETTSEVWLVDARDELAEPWLVRSRRNSVRYYVEHLASVHGPGRLLVYHAEESRHAVDQLDLGSNTWSPFIEAGDDEQITWVSAFERHVVVTLRRSLVSTVRVLTDRTSWDVEFPGDLYNVVPASNPRYHTSELRFFHSSPTTPTRVYSCDMDTGVLTLLRERPVLPGPGGRPYDPGDYTAVREWATADDGTRVPITIVSRVDQPLDGTRPCVLYAYGAYSRSADVGFSINRLSLLDRGFSYAVTHVRGGGEFGDAWHDAGRGSHKLTSITDYLACVRHLVTTGWTSHDRVFARGSSAGGLLVAAAVNQAPQLFGGVVARVPFVDPLSSMLNEDEPLTITERDEWGDPISDQEAYAYLKSYSPYHNVSDQRYPPILAIASLNDTRVRYHQAAKWIARLRARAHGGPFLLHTDLKAGHRGRTGRYDAWRLESMVMAWLVDQAGARAGASKSPVRG